MSKSVPRCVDSLSPIFLKFFASRKGTSCVVRPLTPRWQLYSALTSAIRLESFPTFCACLVGGSTVVPTLILRLWGLVRLKLGSRDPASIPHHYARVIRLLAAFISAWSSFELLNRRPLKLRQNRNSQSSAEGSAVSNQAAADKSPAGLEHHGRPAFAGRTMDLTLFTLTRAVDTVASIAWAQWRSRRKAQGRWTSAESVAPGLVDAGLFAASSAIVMWAWFYVPERLPKSYEKWIGEVAKVDTRLIEALRRARRGIFVYGKDTGQGSLLRPMCKEYGWPLTWGEPSETIPIPCQMVHMSCGPSCEWHAISRFARTFKFACATYIPLQMAVRARSMKSMAAVRRAITEALRSSGFLAAFVSLFYYSVCLARTRLGPKIFSSKNVTPQMWDSGLCVGAGCMMCGWSILVEKARKRQEMALFVAPRAAATVLPRVYDKKYQNRERMAFALSAAMLFACLQERPDLVRGVFGRVAASVLKA
ncbi:uncharacterized protein BDW47DRAFT_116570 [Aspergillus candidus]|uniref:Integral membrane protein n=1 Tax=Aspergillus candidus TaxID=41067 RepID=A0A2I2FFY8_ASPCN|nr:integral membrane protein [Aspergillus candidus]PLB39509.1 integral membrane protein [Aspergillus candidus]